VLLTIAEVICQSSHAKITKFRHMRIQFTNNVKFQQLVHTCVPLVRCLYRCDLVLYMPVESKLLHLTLGFNNQNVSQEIKLDGTSWIEYENSEIKDFFSNADFFFQFFFLIDDDDEYL
jgi:hypothetical protein